MIDSEEKLNELEHKMGVLESTLDEIKSYIRENKSTYETKARGVEDDLPMKMRKKIDNIMENFDFERVHKVMDVIGWKWVFALNGIPSVEELKKAAKTLLVSACKEKTTVSTGGFKAIYEESSRWDDDDDDKDPYVGLEFILEEWEGFDD